MQENKKKKKTCNFWHVTLEKFATPDINVSHVIH